MYQNKRVRRRLLTLRLIVRCALCFEKCGKQERPITDLRKIAVNFELVANKNF